MEIEAQKNQDIHKLPRALVWFRRDLRVDDNPALLEAKRIAEEVVSFPYFRHGCNRMPINKTFFAPLADEIQSNPCYSILTDTHIHLFPRRRRSISARSLFKMVAFMCPSIPRPGSSLSRLSALLFPRYRSVPCYKHPSIHTQHSSCPFQSPLRPNLDGARQ